MHHGIQEMVLVVLVGKVVMGKKKVVGTLSMGTSGKEERLLGKVDLFEEMEEDETSNDSLEGSLEDERVVQSQQTVELGGEIHKMILKILFLLIEEG